MFAECALARVWELTRGLAWLVNALAEEVCSASEALGSGGVALPVNTVAIENAKETLILDRVTDLDQLADKLKEDRVRRVIEPAPAGVEKHSYSIHDLNYVRDLGRVARDAPVRIAKPIHAEVVPRELTYAVQEGLTLRTAWYVDADGILEVAKVLDAFRAYFRGNAEHWSGRFGYKEADPQLLLQAFLHRIVNGGGRLEREYGLGRRRTDLLILWPEGADGDPTRMRKHVIECKVVREGRGLERTIRAGLEQTA